MVSLSFVVALTSVLAAHIARADVTFGVMLQPRLTGASAPQCAAGDTPWARARVWEEHAAFYHGAAAAAAATNAALASGGSAARLRLAATLDRGTDADSSGAEAAVASLVNDAGAAALLGLSDVAVAAGAAAAAARLGVMVVAPRGASGVYADNAKVELAQPDFATSAALFVRRAHTVVQLQPPNHPQTEHLLVNAFSHLGMVCQRIAIVYDTLLESTASDGYLAIPNVATAAGGAFAFPIQLGRRNSSMGSDAAEDAQVAGVAAAVAAQLVRSLDDGAQCIVLGVVPEYVPAFIEAVAARPLFTGGRFPILLPRWSSPARLRLSDAASARGPRIYSARSWPSAALGSVAVSALGLGAAVGTAAFDATATAEYVNATRLTLAPKFVAALANDTASYYQLDDGARAGLVTAAASEAAAVTAAVPALEGWMRHTEAFVEGYIAVRFAATIAIRAGAFSASPPAATASPVAPNTEPDANYLTSTMRAGRVVHVEDLAVGPVIPTCGSLAPSARKNLYSDNVGDLTAARAAIPIWNNSLKAVGAMDPPLTAEDVAVMWDERFGSAPLTLEATLGVSANPNGTFASVSCRCGSAAKDLHIAQWQDPHTLPVNSPSLFANYSSDASVMELPPSDTELTPALLAAARLYEGAAVTTSVAANVPTAAYYATCESDERITVWSPQRDWYLREQFRVRNATFDSGSCEFPTSTAVGAAAIYVSPKPLRTPQHYPTESFTVPYMSNTSFDNGDAAGLTMGGFEEAKWAVSLAIALDAIQLFPYEMGAAARYDVPQRTLLGDSTPPITAATRPYIFDGMTATLSSAGTAAAMGDAAQVFGTDVVSYANFAADVFVRPPDLLEADVAAQTQYYLRLMQRYPALATLTLASMVQPPPYARVGPQLRFDMTANPLRRANFTLPVFGTAEDGVFLPLEDEPLDYVIPDTGTADALFRENDYDAQGTVAEVVFAMSQFLVGRGVKQVVVVARTLRELRMARRSIESASIKAYGDTRVRVGLYAMVQTSPDDETRFSVYRLRSVGDVSTPATWTAVSGGLASVVFPSSGADLFNSAGTQPTTATSALLIVGERLRWLQAVLDVVSKRPGAAPYTLASAGGISAVVSDLKRRSNLHMSVSSTSLALRVRAVLGNIPLYVASAIPANYMPLVNVPLMTPGYAKGLWAQSVMISASSASAMLTGGPQYAAGLRINQAFAMWTSSGGPLSADVCLSNISVVAAQRRLQAEVLADTALTAWGFADGADASTAARQRFYEQLAPLVDRIPSSGACLCRKVFQTIFIGDAVRWAADDSSASWSSGSVVLPNCGVTYLDMPPPAARVLNVAAVVAGVAVAALLLVGAAFWYVTFGQQWMQRRKAPKDSKVPFAFVITDIQSSTTLWARMPHSMADALEHHNARMREAIDETGGYEVKTVGDCFMVAFHTAAAAVRFAVRVQTLLHAQDWGRRTGEQIDDTYRELLALQRDGIEGAGPVLDPHALNAGCAEGTAYEQSWNGLRVRIGVHYGHGTMHLDAVSGRYDYGGPVVQGAHVMEEVAHGGQVCVSAAVLRALGGGTETPNAATAALAYEDASGGVSLCTTLAMQPLEEVTKGADAVAVGALLHVASEASAFAAPPAVSAAVGLGALRWWGLGSVPVPAAVVEDDAATDDVAVASVMPALQVLPLALAHRLFPPLRVARATAAGTDQEAAVRAALTGATLLSADDDDLARAADAAVYRGWFATPTPNINNAPHALDLAGSVKYSAMPSSTPEEDTAGLAGPRPTSSAAPRVFRVSGSRSPASSVSERPSNDANGGGGGGAARADASSAALEQVREQTAYLRRLLRAVSAHDRVRTRSAAQLAAVGAELTTFWHGALQPLRTAARGEVQQALDDAWRVEPLAAAVADVFDATIRDHDTAVAAAAAAVSTASGQPPHAGVKATDAISRASRSTRRSAFTVSGGQTRAARMQPALLTATLRVALRAVRALLTQAQYEMERRARNGDVCIVIHLKESQSQRMHGSSTPSHDAGGIR